MKSKVEAATGRSRIGRQLQRLVLQGAAFAVTGCLLAASQPGSGASSAERRAASHSAPLPAPPPLTIVIVTLDGVRWHEVFEGVDARLAAAHGLAPSQVLSASDLMPNLHAIVTTHGAALGAPGHGATISASGPNFVSLPGYAELLSGRRATRCKDNQCASAGTHTIVDELAASSPGDPSQVAVFTSWADIARVATEQPLSASVSSGRHGGATRAAFLNDAEDRPYLTRAEEASPLPGNGDFRPDVFTADLAIHHLRVHGAKFMFVGLGEPDEFGHQDNYAGYLDALVQCDLRIGEIDRELQRLAARGTRTALFVTADHGRADGFTEHGARFPESARVWLVAAGSALNATGFVAAPRERRLADLAPTVREIAGLPRDRDADAGNPLAELLYDQL